MRTIAETQWAEYQVSVPEGESGPWRVERFEMTEADAKWEMLRGAIGRQGRCRAVYPGTYTRLKRGGTLVMSDTPDEISDHLRAIRLARGRVLIHGLGLGMVLQAVLRKPAVEHVDVVEASADVIALVAPHYADPRVTVHHGDALTHTFPKGTRWDVAWHDIWDGICEDNLPEMTMLKRRYGQKVGWQGCWAEEMIRREARRTAQYWR